MNGPELQPGTVIKGDSGKEWVVGEPIGFAPDPDSPCDAPDGGSYMMRDGVIRCRCTVCPRCHHHTGNSHQGHYWRYCKVTGTMRDFHFCCLLEPGCELEEDADAQE